MRSAEGRRKAVSTCSSHLTVVTVYYGTGMFMYMRPKSLSSAEGDKVISLFYAVINPALNPLIYSLRDKDMKSLKETLRNMGPDSQAEGQALRQQYLRFGFLVQSWRLALSELRVHTARCPSTTRTLGHPLLHPVTCKAVPALGPPPWLFLHIRVKS
ncbi:Olfactory receptor 8U8 [Tupaia chinensis]|uniref:Olfactory receptor 8U8 n=1 Tax=Tupaia chinensis TaxID=246437 RepID=L9JH48_TUPCH|nr:Olfactory receptor 8U8 [Tupaia chinensis]